MNAGKIPFINTEPLYMVKMLSLPHDNVEFYWQTLYKEGYLDFRLCNVDNPTWEDVKEMIHRMGDTMFAVVNEKAEIQGEFMLENFTGLAAQIHFSIKPGQHVSSAVRLMRWASDEVLHHGFIKTLYGLTPVTNRAARIYNVRAGFKCIGTLPNGIKDRGKIVDGLIMVKEASWAVKE